MGVRGLETFMEQYCPGACYTVDLRTIIADYQEEHNVETAEIVVDAESCCTMWCEGLDCTIGTEVREIIKRLRIFVKAFTKIGAKLTFFLGGSTPEKKRKTWTDRRIKSMDNTLKIFKIFREGGTYRDIPLEIRDSSAARIPLNMKSLLISVFKNTFNCPIFMSDGECDEDIIEYAHANESFAIFGQDTDFVISDVGSLVLSARHFNIDYEGKLTTMVYDREELCRNLRIRLDQLPLFAILVGNDLIPQDLLKSFHNKLCKWNQPKFIPWPVLMPAIGKYISELPDVPVDDLLKMACSAVFGNDNRLSEMKIAYESYLIHQKPNEIPTKDVWSRILHVALNRMKVCDFPSTNHTILKYRTFGSSTAMEDFRTINDGNTNWRNRPSATVLRPIRRRLYGILLFQQRRQKPLVTVTEWCGENLQSYKSSLQVEPEYPKAHHPGLLALWDEKRAEKLAKHKWTLFLKAVSPTIENIEAWSSFNEEFIVPVAACYYLLEAEYMSMWELHAILATIAVTPLYNRAKLRTLGVGRPSVRAIQLSVTFTRACDCVLWLISACGCYLSASERRTFIHFEGKLFQMIYRKAKAKVGFKDLCEKNKTSFKTFSDMMNLMPTNHQELRKLKNANSSKNSSSKQKSMRSKNLFEYLRCDDEAC